MDTNDLIAEAKAKFSHNSTKAYLREKYNSKLIIAEQGGLWKITPEFISFLASVYIPNDVVIMDLYESPVKVDRTKFLNKAIDTYTSVMNEYYKEWEKLKKNR